MFSSSFFTDISQSVCADKNSNLTITKSSKQSAAAAAVVCRTIEQQSAADSAPSSHFPNKDKTSSKTENKKVVSLSQSGKNSNLKETREERKSFDSKTENYDIGYVILVLVYIFYILIYAVKVTVIVWLIKNK